MMVVALVAALIAFAALVAFVASGSSVALWVLFLAGAVGLGALVADIWRKKNRK